MRSLTLGFWLPVAARSGPLTHAMDIVALYGLCAYGSRADLAGG